MPRYAPIITLDELKKKIDPLVLDNEEFPYEMPEKILKDISKIQFDFENCETGINPDWVVKMGKSRYHNEGFSNYPCGYKVLENNLGNELVVFWENEIPYKFFAQDNIFHSDGDLIKQFYKQISSN